MVFPFFQKSASLKLNASGVPSQCNFWHEGHIPLAERPLLMTQ